MSGRNKGQSEKNAKDVYLSLGSNIGDRRLHLEQASETIQVEIGSISKYSRIYETEPWGNRNQEYFLNQVLKVETLLNPDDVLINLLEIEKKMGRIRKNRWEPRQIDIDILFYNNLIINKHNLQIPHPRAHNRLFVMLPMAELAPQFNHPVLKVNMRDLSKSCVDTSKIALYNS